MSKRWQDKLALFQKLGNKNFTDNLETNKEKPKSSDSALSFLESLYKQRGLKLPGNSSKNLSSLFGSSNSQKESADIASNFGITLMILGCLAVLLNVIILCILARHRRHVLKHAFYMLICNFAFIDSLKGSCLILWASKTLVTTSDDNISLIKMEQVTLIILRFANLGTILNLLMITLNEFIFIKCPLKYHSWVTKRRILCLVLFSWFLSMTFTLCSTFARSNIAAMSIVPCPNTTNLNGTGLSRFGDKCVRYPPPAKDIFPIHSIMTMTLIGFCVLCLVVVIACYAIFFRIIHKIQKEDSRLMSESNKRKNDLIRRKSSTHSCGSNDDFGHQKHHEESKLKRQLLRRSKYVLVIGSVIFIYILYLFSYGTIQVLQILRLSFHQKTSIIIRWCLRILIGLHSIFQPLCYFRMREFRQFVNKSLGYPCQKQSKFVNTCTTSEWVSERENDTLLPSTVRTSSTVRRISNQAHFSLGSLHTNYCS